MTKTYYTAVANAWERERQQRLDALKDQSNPREKKALAKSAARCKARVEHFRKLAEEAGE